MKMIYFRATVIVLQSKLLCRDAIIDAIKLFGINWRPQLPDVTEMEMNTDTLSMLNHYRNVEQYYGFDTYVAPMARSNSMVVVHGNGDPRTTTITNKPHLDLGISHAIHSYLKSRPSKGLYLALGGPGMLALGFAAPVLATVGYAIHQAAYNDYGGYGQNAYRRL